MVFRFSAEGIPEKIKVRNDGESKLVSVLVGSNDTGSTFHLSVTLDKTSDEAWELNFCLIEYRSSTVPEHMYFQSAEVGRVIPRREKELILDVLIAATRKLVMECQPAVVVMRAPQVNLPEKAKHKYYSLVQVFLSCQYAVSLLGPSAWKMERSTPICVRSE